MKRKLILALAVLMAFASSLTLAGCQDKNTIRVNEVTHSIFYAPLYIAMNKGYFADYGLKIKLTDGQGSHNTMAALTSNSVIM